MPGGRGSLGSRGPGWFPGHCGRKGRAECRRVAAAGCGHRPVPAGLPGLLRGPAPEPSSPAAGEGGEMGGKGLQEVGRGTGGRSHGLEGGGGCRCSWGSQELVFLILNTSCHPLPTL